MRRYITDNQHLEPFTGWPQEVKPPYRLVYLCGDVDSIHEQNTALIVAQKVKIAELEKALREIHDEVSYTAGPNFNPELARITSNVLMERVNK